MNNPKRKPEFHLILASLIATGAGVGKLPIAPGTWASIVAIPVASLLYILGGTWLLSVTIFLGFVIGIFVMVLNNSRLYLTTKNYYHSDVNIQLSHDLKKSLFYQYYLILLKFYSN